VNKFKFTFKVKELELQVEGSREDMGNITHSIGRQLNSLIQTADAIHELPSSPGLSVTETGEILDGKLQGKKKRSSTEVSKKEKGKAYDLTHDPLKYGSPIQSWKAVEKALWLLFVMQHEADIAELSAGEIAETFNKHFKQQGKIRASNVSRDFGKQKSGTKAWVGENANGNPTKWFLTAEGIKIVQKLIADLKSGTE
jgi:hypothetical protein